MGGVAAGAVLAAAVPEAQALREAISIATDPRIRTVVYNPNEVYRFEGHYGYQSSIVFEAGEEIETISIGDSIAWQITPTGNRIFLKPIEEDADTNMTVLTNKRTYHFELYASEAEDMHDKNMVFDLRFIYTDSAAGSINRFTYETPLPDLADPVELRKYNFNYTMSGDDHIAPIRIFDDGTFTYMEFAPTVQDLPAVFAVDKENRESLVNFRMRERYLIVERIAPRFTLRHGIDTLCVYNEAIYAGDAAEKSGE